MVIINTDRLKTYATVMVLCLLVSVVVYVRFTPDTVLNKSLPPVEEVWDGLKENSIKVYNKVFGGEGAGEPSGDKSFFDCKLTADGKQFCDGKVYECDTLSDKDGKKECKNAKDLGELKKENVFEKGDLLIKNPVLKNVTFNDKDLLFGDKKYVDAKGNILGVRFKKIANKNAVLIDNVFFEDDEEKSVDKMRNLNRYYKENYVKDDGVNRISFGVLNLTSIELFLKTNETNVPFRIDGVQVSTVDYSGSYVFIDKNVLSHNFTLGFSSSTVTAVSANNATFEGNFGNFLNEEGSNNHGGETSIQVNRRGSTYGDGFSVAFYNLGVREIIGSGMNILNLTMSYKMDTALNDQCVTFTELLGTFNEGSGTGQAGNLSMTALNDTMQLSDGTAYMVTCQTNDCEIKDELKGAYYGNQSVCSESNNQVVEMTQDPVSKTAIQNAYDQTGNITWSINSTNQLGDSSDYHYHRFYSEESAGNEPSFVVEYESGNTAPSCTQAGTNITIDEDSGIWYLDQNMSEALNISCSDAEGNALTYTEDGETGTGGSFTNPNNDDLIFTTGANASGTKIVTYTVSDGTDSVKVSAQAIVTAGDDAPWWDEITNGSGTKIKTGLGYQPIDINASQYFRDVEDDQTPSNITITTNETSVDCYMNTVSNFTIFCEPDSVSAFIIILNGSDSAGLSELTSFEEYVIYPPSKPTVTFPVINVHHGNVTITWTEGISPQGDEIAYYNITLNKTGEWYHTINPVLNGSSYNWDTREVDDAFESYTILIEVCDNNSLCSLSTNVFRFSVNNTPHWDNIGNATALDIKINLGKQPVLNNVSQYFHDYFDDQTPTSIIVDDNETGISCEIETNLSLFCTPTAFKGDYIITLNGTNSVANSSFESFEGYVSNTAPTIPTTIIPEQNALNDTAQLRLSCDGSTDPEGDAIYYDYFGDTNTNPTTSICYNAGTECLWNNTDINTWVYWNCQANDTYENSTLTTTRGIRTETWDLINLTINNTGYDYEGSTITISANLSWNEIRYKSMTGILNFSGTYYASPTRTDYDNYTEYSQNVMLPAIDDDTTQPFNWMINLTYQNDSIFENNTYEGSILNKNIWWEGNCTEANASESMAVNFSFWSENLGLELSLLGDNETAVEYQATFIMYKDNILANTTQTWSLTNITSFGICIPKDEEFKSMAIINYYEDLYDLRQYYFYQQTLNNITQQIPLYLLEIALGSGISITVNDPSGNAMSDAYIHVYKYYPGTDNYALVNMGHTGSDGKDYLYLRQFDALYKIRVYKDGSEVYTDDINRKIEADTLTLVTIGASLGDLLDVWNSISYTLANTTDKIILTYSDSGTTATKYCLTVYKTNSSDQSYVCNTCSTKRAETITCDINDYDGIYIANAWASINPNRPFATLIVEKLKSIWVSFGKTGLFASFLIILTLGCIGLWMGKVSTTVIGTLLGIFICKVLGMLTMDYTPFLGIIIAGIVVIVYAKD